MEKEDQSKSPKKKYKTKRTSATIRLLPYSQVSMQTLKG